jgi:hypothetical protein
MRLKSNRSLLLSSLRKVSDKSQKEERDENSNDPQGNR